MEKYDKALRPATVLYGGKNSYRIDRVLGQGTFGITYLAYTTATVEGPLGKLQTEMQVAVKEFFMSDINGREGSTVTTGGSGELFDKYRHKFSREAANLAKLSHPGIVKVIETFEANGTSYYAMEYCAGGSLDALIVRRGSLPQDEALRYFGQIASALSYMHSQLMLHLDLKPGNVMLRSSGEAVLIDFGLSKQFNDKGEPESSTTIGGGTPGYAPIEQANYKEDGGSKLPVTMDVYSLGGTLYKMLTGKRPPVASDVLARFPGILEKSLRERGVGDEVIAAICRAMQPIPDNRYQSVAEFAAALSESTVSQPEPEPELEPDPESEPNPEPEVILIDDGEQHEEEQQQEQQQWQQQQRQQQQQQRRTEDVRPVQPEEQPRRKWLPWVVGAAVAVVAFVAVLLRADPQIDVPSDVVATVTQAADTVSATEQPVQQVATPQQPAQQQQQQPIAQTQQQPQRPVQQSESVIEPVQPQRQQSNLPDIEMVYVAGGTFTMGATSEQGSEAGSNEKPAHRVTLDSYYIGKYEVTQKLWKAVMGNNPSRFKGDNLPVECVSWNDVQEFLSKLNSMTGKKYRLPTEAEWEYAARGGNRSNGYKYSGSNSIGSVAWCNNGFSGDKTHAVGTRSPNELGIYDMSGNVWEWCQDWFGSYSSSSQSNPKGPNSGSNRVYRGGSWANPIWNCRVSYRIDRDPDYWSSNLGFRLAL